MKNRGRNEKIRDAELKYDFLPAMQEITERPPNRLGSILLYTIVLLIITAFLWAANMTLDVTVSASGTVLPQGGLKAVTSEISGEIARVHAEEGAHAEKGEVLAVLDDAALRQDMKENDYELDILRCQRELYASVYEQIEKNGIENPVTFEKKYDGTKLLIADAIIREHDAFLSGLKELDSMDDGSEEVQAPIEAQKEARAEERKLSIVRNLNTLDTKIESAELTKERLMQSEKRYEICAPAGGTLTQSTRLFEGNYLAAGTAAGYVIPEDKELIFHAYIADEDIGAIAVSDAASVRIAAFRDTEYSRLDGEILTIGKTSVSMENLGTVYQVEIKLKDKPDGLLSGMEGTCDILTGKRTVLDYFLEPFRKGLEESLRER